MSVYKITREKLPVYIHPGREEMGAAAAERAGELIRSAIKSRREANVIFAAAPSQNELLNALKNQNIDWGCVRGFHQDEYIGLDENHPAGFGNFLKRHIFDELPFKEIYLMGNPTENRAEICCENYAALLREFPPDVILLGMGENGHVAFNDPPVADFNDPKTVKIVELDPLCRRQQVNDGCFDSLAEVPTHAITLTMSAVMSVPAAVITVPSAKKAKAVHDALFGEITTACPASVLRRHKNAALYLDSDSAGTISETEIGV